MSDARVWIGCLGCYNAGELVGNWSDAEFAGDVTPEQVHGGETDHEELWVFDHEGFLGALTGECSPGWAQQVAEGLSDIPEDGAPAFAIWLRLVESESYSPWEWANKFREQYRGEWGSQADYAENWFYDTAEPELQRLVADKVWPFDSIDWDAASEDMFVNGSEEAEASSNGGVYVFVLDD
ncbi:antirestriction protein ArdA [Streptomyces sp. NBC_01198]|uniref:antirestriction protein ArdA n=1 Tax=Streptomyces sp. NBC_01198 TaxID=2903769 RepID=UPI002E1076AB|nr:antirestriction protein ArdA [Streptomyces sp. NBC_01198]